MDMSAVYAGADPGIFNRGRKHFLWRKAAAHICAHTQSGPCLCKNKGVSPEIQLLNLPLLCVKGQLKTLVYRIKAVTIASIYVCNRHKYRICFDLYIKASTKLTRTPSFFLTIKWKPSILWPSKLYEHLENYFLQFDTKFASKEQRLAKIGTILWLLMLF